MRFLAFLEWEDRYSSPMKHFLNAYMEGKRWNTDAELEPLGKLFSKTMRFSIAALGDRPFRPDRALNVAVFDAVSTSVAKMLLSNKNLSEEESRRAYEDLLQNQEFINGYSRATADAENVKRRFKEAQAAFGVT